MEVSKRRLPVQLDEVVIGMESGMDETQSFLDTQTGQVMHLSEEYRSDLTEILDGLDVSRRKDPNAVKAAIDASDVQDWEMDILWEMYQCEWDTSKRFVEIPKLGSRRGFEDMEDFTATLTDQGAAYQLKQALRGQRPFRMFKDALERFPRLRLQWFAFHDERMKERVAEWLEEIGIEPD